MPYGADRASLVRAFKSLQWDIKPLQPVSSVPTRGMMWTVLAVTPPPQSVFQLSHGEIVVTKVGSGPKETKKHVPMPVASTDTIQLCSAGDVPDGQDPWLVNDPWQSKKATQLVAPTPSATLQQMETRIETSVMERIAKLQPPVPMEQDDVPDRLNLLEANVQQLMTHHRTLEHQMHESDRRNATQLSAMQVQLDQQGQHLQGAIESQKQNMQALFENQMSQIRSLLTKRPAESME